MADWEKEIAELRTDVKYIREDVAIMQKQIRDLNKTSNMGLGGIKVFLAVGGILGAIWAFMKISNQEETKEKAKEIWEGLSKQRKMFAIAVAVIIVIIILTKIF